ncbi:MAG: 5,6-dimethylbenzimidazole synthase [Aeromicrobium sp.]
MPTHDLTAQDLYSVINRRRDVRAEFSGGDLDESSMRRVLAAAHSAPSVGHTQPWDFILVKDPETRSAFQKHVQTEREIFNADLDAERQEKFSRIKVEGIMESGLGVVVTYDPSRGGDHVLGRHAIADAGLYSTCLAIQNLWLAATAEGLGVGWVSFYREAFLADLLGIPDGIRPIAWLCLGAVTKLQDVPDLERHGWRTKRPVEEAIHFEKFQVRTND